MKYYVEYTEEAWYRIEVEAENREEARKKFYSGEIDLDNAYQFGGQISDGISIEEKSGRM